VYNPDPEYHLSLRTETDKSKIYPKKKGGAAARAANTSVVDQDEPTPAAAPEPETPSKAEPVVEAPRRTTSGAGRRHVNDSERPVSPVSSGSSSASESPLIQKMKLNGTGHTKSHSNTPMPPPATDDVPPPPPGHSDRPKSPVHTSEVREKNPTFTSFYFYRRNSI